METFDAQQHSENARKGEAQLKALQVNLWAIAESCEVLEKVGDQWRGELLRKTSAAPSEN